MAQNKEQDPLLPNQNRNKQPSYPDPRSHLLQSTSFRSTVDEQNKRLSGFKVELWGLCAGQKGGLLEEDSLNSFAGVL